MTLLDYWNQRATTYSTSDVVGRKILAAHIQQIHPRSLIEIGCGNGILFSVYKQVPQVSALDFSLKMLDRARSRCERHGFNIKLFHHDITDSSPEGHWELAVTRTCLMHIPPELIRQAVENIGAVCDQALIFEYWQPNVTEPLASHNWLHDYPFLFENVGFASLDFYSRGDMPQALFLFHKV